MWRICKKISNGKEWPEGWNRSTIALIKKKGERERPEDYTGVTIMSSLYKICATALTERVVQEMRDKSKLLIWQEGEKEGRKVSSIVHRPQSSLR